MLLSVRRVRPPLTVNVLLQVGRDGRQVLVLVSGAKELGAKPGQQSVHQHLQRGVLFFRICNITRAVLRRSQRLFNVRAK
jgi:hypothetical protein